MPKLKILYICHNHPSLFPGGAETHAFELYEAMRASSEFEPIFLARVGPKHRPSRAGTPFSVINSDINQYFFYTDPYDFDSLYGTLRHKQYFNEHLREFLVLHQPDIVHFQHTLFLGYD